MSELKNRDKVHANAFRLLDAFSHFYSDVLSIKRADEQERLGDFLFVPENQRTSSLVLAQALSAYLENSLRVTYKELAYQATDADAKIYRLAVYVMAALVDEVFILEFKWKNPAISDAWVDLMLEQKLFKSNVAGSKYFDILKAVLNNKFKGCLNAEMACVLLMAFDLGFKGAFRGKHGVSHLKTARMQLLRCIEKAYPQDMPIDPHLNDESFSTYAQAYQYTLYGGKDLRLAPLSPWKKFISYAAVFYFVLSAFCWFFLMHTFEKFINH